MKVGRAVQGMCPVCCMEARTKTLQMKVHLAKTVQLIVKMVPGNDQKSLDKGVARLKKLFWPINIAEQRGLDFQQKSQGEDSCSWAWICKLWGKEPFHLSLLRSLIGC